jgi:hypothetical protein
MCKNFGRLMLRFLGVVTIVIFVILIKIAMIIGPPLYHFYLFINSKRKKKEVEYGWDYF